MKQDSDQPVTPAEANDSQTASDEAVVCKELLGEARVAAVNGYMGDRRSLVEALEKLSSYYNTHEKNREWLVAEITRIDEAVAKLLASPNAGGMARGLAAQNPESTTDLNG